MLAAKVIVIGLPATLFVLVVLYSFGMGAALVMLAFLVLTLPLTGLIWIIAVFIVVLGRKH